jgi:hypothetical protein
MQLALDNLQRMMAIWNSDDEAQRRQLAEQALEHNVHFADPNHNIIGREAFLAMVAQVQARIPGASYCHASRIDVQNNFCRYHWKIDWNGKRVMNGFDMTEVNDGGKIVKVIGFFGPLDFEG